MTAVATSADAQPIWSVRPTFRITPTAIARLAPGLAAFLLSAIACIRYQVSVLDVVRFTLENCWAILLPGVLTHRALRGRSTDLVTELAWGVVTGLAIQLAAWAAFVSIGAGSWLIVYPLVFVVVFAAVPGLRGCWTLAPYARRTGIRTAWSLTVVYAASLAVLVYYTFRALPLPPRTGLWYQDMYWHAAISAEAMHSVPPRVPQLDDHVLIYHWFSNAHMAADALISHVDVLTVTGRLWYLPVYAAITLTTYVLTVSLTGRSWAGVLAAALIVAPAGISVVSWVAPIAVSGYVPYSPSQLFSLPFLAFGTWLLIEAVRGRLTARGWVMFALIVLATCGAKSSALPVLLGGACLGALVSLRDRSRRWPALGAVALIGVVIAASSKVVAGGSSGSTLTLNATVIRLKAFRIFLDHGHPMSEIHLAGALVLAIILIQFLYGATGFALLHRSTRRDPAVWVFIGIFLAAQLALFLINHPSMSQLYFVEGIDPLWAVFAVWGAVAAISRARRDSSWRAAFAVMAAYGILGTATVFVIRHLCGHHLPGARSALHRMLFAVGVVGMAMVLTAVLLIVLTRRAPAIGRLVAAGVAGGLLVAATVPSVWEGDFYQARRDMDARPNNRHLSVAEVAGARWLAGHSPLSATTATNVYCLPVRTRRHCDARAFWVQGLSERSSYLGAWAYEDQNEDNLLHQKQSDYIRSFWNVKRLALNNAAFADPNPAVLTQLYDYGVRWLYADSAASRVSPLLGRYATLRWHSGTVWIYQLRAPQV